MTAEREQLEAVWRARAARLAKRQPLAAASAGGALDVLVIGIGQERYGIALTAVAEALPPLRCTPVPGSRASLAGLIEAHGEIRPVLDLRRMLGLEPEAGGRGAPLPVVLLRVRGIEFGLRADCVERIRRIDRGELQPLAARYLESLTRDTLMLLSAEALVDELVQEEK